MKVRLTPSRLIAGIICILFLIPVLTIVGHIFLPASDTLSHLVDTVLPRYIWNSLGLMVGVGLLTALFGTGAAWLVTSYRFPGSVVFEWALFLPLAVPTYVIAYAYTDFLQFSGPLQTAIRDIFDLGPRDFRLPEIRSLSGAILTFSFVLYPYVYLITRAALLTQSESLSSAARTLGLGARSRLFRLTLPMARPAIAAGVALVLMETLAEYGAVSYFGVQTFTTGIYRAWFSMGDKVAAAHLSVMLFAFVIVLFALEARSRRRVRFYQTDSRFKANVRARLDGRQGWIASLFCALPITLGFVLPVLFLLRLMGRADSSVLNLRFAEQIQNTLTLALVTATLAVALAVIIAYARREAGHGWFRAWTRIASLGYAIPGTIIAIGVLIPFAAFDNAFDGWMREAFGISTGLLLTGSIAALVFAYLVRFLSVSLQTVESGMEKISPAMDAAALTLGAGLMRRLREVHAPLLRGSLFTAFLLVMVDVMKELPATLIMRPFNFETLAVTAHNYAADERLAEAAFPALTIVLVGLIPIIILMRATVTRLTGSETASKERKAADFVA